MQALPTTRVREEQVFERKQMEVNNSHHKRLLNGFIFIYNLIGKESDVLVIMMTDISIHIRGVYEEQIPFLLLVLL